MLPVRVRGERGPLIVMLHWLGGSADTWTEVSDALADRGFRCAAIDLPGFGRAVDTRAYSIAEMATAVTATIRDLRGEDNAPWLLAGHSMGGKLAAVIARYAANNVAGLANLGGVVLVSPSPPGVEPMKESKRRQAIEDLGRSTGDAAEDCKHAQAFVIDNVGNMPLPEAILKRTTDDVLRMNRQVLVAWMTGGSKEDWSERVGTLDVPALILAGTEEAALGPHAQARLTLPHFAHATLVPLQGCSHLAPLERPWELVDHLSDFAATIGLSATLHHDELSADFAALVASDKTSAPTRAVLTARLTVQDNTGTTALSTDQRHILQALVRRVIPGAPLSIAVRLDRQLMQSDQDGTRHATLPADADAWRIGLASLDAAAMRRFRVPFIALDGTDQDELLDQARSGELGKGVAGTLHWGDSADSFTAQQMQDWFEDVRGELAKAYVSDPRTMQRIGFTGFADEQGFAQIKLDQSESFENMQEATR